VIHRIHPIAPIAADRCRFVSISARHAQPIELRFRPERSDDDVIRVPDRATSRFDVEKP
jgi:hypothetical protein